MADDDTVEVWREYGLASAPRIVGIEISIDWRPKDGSNQSRWLMTALMRRHLLPDVQWISGKLDKPRFTYSEGKYKKTTRLYAASWWDRYGTKGSTSGGAPGTSKSATR